MDEKNMENYLIELAGAVANSDSYGKYYVDNFERSGSPKGYDLEDIFSNPQAHIKDIIELAKYYYNKTGIIMRVVNIIRDFGATSYKINFEKDNKDAKKVIDSYCKRIKLGKLLTDILFEIALTWNCAGYDRYGKRVDIYPISRIEVSELIINNKPVLFFKNEMTLTDLIEDNPALKKKLNLAYPKEVARGIRQDKERILLDIENTFFLKVNSSRYEAYGVPFLLTAFDDIAHKTVLKEAERSTATGIIEKILRVSVGDKDNKPKQPAIDFYDKLVNGKKGSVKVTVPYFVNMDWIEPSTEIFGKEKFEQIDSDILNDLGVSLTLISGQGGSNYSEAHMSVTGLIKTIEYLRKEIPDVVEELFTKELKRHGISEEFCPKFKFNPVVIDESTKLEMLQWLFQSAGLPYEILYNESGYDYLSVKLMREKENEENVEDVFKLREQPFQGKGNPEDDGRPEKSVEERESDKNQSNNKQPRPSKVK